jgi:hypothetical protein
MVLNSGIHMYDLSSNSSLASIQHQKTVHVQPQTTTHHLLSRLPRLEILHMSQDGSDSIMMILITRML